jgi:Fervidolysin N-terminal prodomain
VAALSTDAHAQKIFSRGPSPDVGRPVGPGGGGGFRGPGWGAVVPGIIMAVPQGYTSAGPVVNDNLPNQRRPQQANRQRPSGAPPANERRFVPDEVVIELSNSVGAQQVDALQRRFRLTRIESQRFQLSNTTLYRWRIPDRRSVATVVRSLEGDRLVASAQPNYLFALQEDQTTTGGDSSI